jgi:hypothetical protein
MRFVSAVLASLPLLTCGPAAWSNPVVVRPATVTSITASCAAYSATLAASGVIDGAGMAHPGACQHTELGLTVSGQPLAGFRARVDAWRGTIAKIVYSSFSDPSWPYQVNEPARIRIENRFGEFAGTTIDRPPLVQPPSRPYAVEGGLFRRPSGREWCVHAKGLAAAVGAVIETHRLAWTPTPANRPMCSAEARRVDPGRSAIAALAAVTADQLVQDAAAAFPDDTFCSNDRRAAETALADGVLAALGGLAATAAQAWELSRPVFDATAACAPSCGLCAAGWAGSIVCVNEYTNTTKVDPNTPPPSVIYNDHLSETQTFAIGGAATPASKGTTGAFWRGVAGEMTLDRKTGTGSSVRTWRLDPSALQAGISLLPQPGGVLRIASGYYGAYNIPPTTSKAWKKTFTSLIDPDFDVQVIVWPPGRFDFTPAATAQGRTIRGSRVVATGLPGGYWQFGPGTGTTTCTVDLLEQP